MSMCSEINLDRYYIISILCLSNFNNKNRLRLLLVKPFLMP